MKHINNLIEEAIVDLLKKYGEKLEGKRQTVFRVRGRGEELSGTSCNVVFYDPLWYATLQL